MSTGNGNKPQGRRPDAVRCPRDFPQPGQFPGIREVDRDAMRKILFGRALGTRIVFSSRLPLHGESLIRANPEHTLLHPYGHPLAGQDRYEWFIAIIDTKTGTFTPGMPVTGDPEEDGRVKLGYLKADPHASDPEAQKKIADEYDRRQREYVASGEHRERMAALGIEPMGATPAPPNAATPADKELNPPPQPRVPHAQAPSQGFNPPPIQPPATTTPPSPEQQALQAAADQQQAQQPRPPQEP